MASRLPARHVRLFSTSRIALQVRQRADAKRRPNVADAIVPLVVNEMPSSSTYLTALRSVASTHMQSKPGESSLQLDLAKAMLHDAELLDVDLGSEAFQHMAKASPITSFSWLTV